MESFSKKEKMSSLRDWWFSEVRMGGGKIGKRVNFKLPVTK